METPDGTNWWKAPQIVRKNDRTAFGVLPGGNNRTPLCEIRAMDESLRDKPVLQLFGENFNFEPVRKYGRYRTIASKLGPAIPEVMDWYSIC